MYAEDLFSRLTLCTRAWLFRHEAASLVEGGRAGPSKLRDCGKNNLYKLWNGGMGVVRQVFPAAGEAREHRKAKRRNRKRRFEAA